jgi:hypothetical protein
MNRISKAALIGLAVLAVAVAGIATLSRHASPATSARADSYRVWIALLKGFNGDVYYVGSDSTNDYFRLGMIFWSYYKVPLCAAQLPQVFPVGAGKPYLVHLHVQSDNTIQVGKSCAGTEHVYELGKLDRSDCSDA